MKLNIKNFLIIALALFSSVILTGCQTAPKSIYQWDDYQPEVYNYFKGTNTEEQIIALEKDLEDFKAHGTLAPPGFHAHLGMLYSSVGKLDLGVKEFMTEKKLFPESASYMDFLMKKTTKKEQ